MSVAAVDEAEYLDALGRDIKLGDYIVYAAYRQTVSLKFGRVMGFNANNKYRPGIMVKTVSDEWYFNEKRDWTDGWHVQNLGRPVFIDQPAHVMIVNLDQLTDGVKELLDG